MLILGVWHSVSLDPSWNGSWAHLGCCFITYGEEDGVIVNCCSAAQYLQLLFTDLAHVMGSFPCIACLPLSCIWLGLMLVRLLGMDENSRTATLWNIGWPDDS
ncbi:hypothetical protein Nepgr_008087 [Nepenthes gracilis]|uniref:Uncharacterized protein n=1 Tax=Nepenthes gracilis TaxID=150966 RepID=A0AAD3S840_NEPGR|nr:hypothetical protein Nepgr_008087 [Nepenthes gracilis]